MAKIRGKKRMWRLATLLDKIEVIIVTGPPDIPSYSSLNTKKFITKSGHILPKFGLYKSG